MPGTKRKQEAAAAAGSVIVQIVGDGNAVSPGLPYLELARYTGLYSRIRDDPEIGGPNEIDLIRPFTRAIELVGRESELASLRDWLKDDSLVSVRVLTGGPGLGKTRLALELVREATAGNSPHTADWRAGFLTRPGLARFLGQPNVATWAWNAPVLVVVDYASASARGLNHWMRLLAEHPCWDEGQAGPPLRVLLLERHATPGAGWWAETFGRGEEAVLEGMLDPAEPVVLRALERLGQRREIIERTLARLGSGLTLPEDDGFGRRLAELTWGGVPLLLMIAAVAAARTGVNDALALGADRLALNVAENELCRVRKVTRVDASLGPFVDHMVAIATLRQGLTEDAVLDAIEAEVTELGYRLPVGAAPLRDGLTRALPDGAGGVSAVGPDMIGEALLISVWSETDTGLPAIGRAHALAPVAVMETLIRTCQDYVIRGYSEPLKWLETLFDARTDGYALIELDDALPKQTVELRELGLEVSRSVAGLFGSFARGTEDTNVRSVFARSLLNLSFRLSELGLREDALDAAKKTVVLCRELAAARPDSFRPDLANSLNNLSVRLSELGLREDALAAAEETVALYRELVAARPDTFQPGLAMSLNNLSNNLSQLGRREDSLAAATEALAFYRELAVARPDTFRPNLAASLNNVSYWLSELGLREDALAEAKEAVAIYRELAAARPDAFRPDLAMSLSNLSSCLSVLGLQEDALGAAGEAVEVYRGLAAARPSAFQPGLAMALDNLSIELSKLGRREAALDAAAEATALCRRLAAARPDAFRPDFAMSLNNLSNRMSELGRQEAALDAIQEAVAIRRELAAARPDAFQPNLAVSLTNLAKHLASSGRGEEALAAAGEAAALHRGLAAARPDAFRPSLATSLTNLSVHLSQCGECEEALDVAAEAAELYRELAVAHPDAFGPSFAASLTNLSVHLSGCGQYEEALDVAEEAATTLRGSFLAAPATFATAMAGIVANYVECSRAAGRETDSDLIEPINEVLARLESDKRYATEKEILMSDGGVAFTALAALKAVVGVLAAWFKRRVSRNRQKPDKQQTASVTGANATVIQLQGDKNEVQR